MTGRTYEIEANDAVASPVDVIVMRRELSNGVN